MAALRLTMLIYSFLCSRGGSRPIKIPCLPFIHYKLSRKAAMAASRLMSNVGTARHQEGNQSYSTMNTAVDQSQEFGTSRLADIDDGTRADIADGPSNNWLVVGDGDLSYCATIAERLARDSIRLFATVLEEESVHNRVYEMSRDNTATILSHERRLHHPIDHVLVSSSWHRVQFGVDATSLTDVFPEAKFQTIEFNFPHWRGKTNAKRNRQLLDDFFASAVMALEPSPGSEIRIALCQGQGGFPASSLAEWRKSWLVTAYAAEHGLLLKSLTSYTPEYAQSSHRGVDRPWIKDGAAQQYVFRFPDGSCVQDSLQISCRHELRIMLHPEKLQTSSVTREDIVMGDAVFELVQGFVPDGIRIEVAARDLLIPCELKEGHVPLAVFLLSYSGERMPLTRGTADCIRAKLEAAVCEQWTLDVAKGGRLVSRPYPRNLLPQLIKEYDH